MDTGVVLGCLRASWQDYLTQHGHTTRTTGDIGVILSHDRRRHAYRWLLLVGTSPAHLLDRRDRRWLRSQLKLARESGEKAYLVAGLIAEPSRIVALPVRAALKDGRLHLHKGGIAWDS